MTGRETRQLEMLRNVYTICTGAQCQKIPDLPKQFARQIERLGETLAALQEVQTARGARGAFQVARAGRRMTVERLTDEFLTPMRRIAKVQGVTVPGIRAPFAVPRPRSAVSDFVTAARRFAERAAPHAAVFVEGGMDDDFLDQLRTVADALEHHADTVETTRTGRAAATQAMRGLLRQGRGIAALLDTILRKHLARLQRAGMATSTLHGFMAGWESASHVRRDPVRRARRLKVAL